MSETDPAGRFDIEDAALSVGLGSDAIQTDAIEKVNAGAQLTYALFYRDVEWWRGQPRSVTVAYMRACNAYGINNNPHQAGQDG